MCKLLDFLFLSRICSREKWMMYIENKVRTELKDSAEKRQDASLVSQSSMGGKCRKHVVM